MNELSLFSESMNGAQSTDMEQSVKALSSSNNLNNVVEVYDDDEFEDIDLADFKHDYRTGEPALYVGSYKKYSEGDLTGCWVSIAKCADYDEFMRVCHYIHRDEGEDVELMFQDADNVPECWYSECSLDEETFDLIKAYAELDEDEQRAYEAYLDLRCESDVTVEDFREHYCGEWNSEEEFTENLIEDLGILDEIPEHLRRFFDVSAYSRELFQYDYDFCDNFVFRTM